MWCLLALVAFAEAACVKDNQLIALYEFQEGLGTTVANSVAGSSLGPLILDTGRVTWNADSVGVMIGLGAGDGPALWSSQNLSVTDASTIDISLTMEAFVDTLSPGLRAQLATFAVPGIPSTCGALADGPVVMCVSDAECDSYMQDYTARSAATPLANQPYWMFAFNTDTPVNAGGQLRAGITSYIYPHSGSDAAAPIIDTRTPTLQAGDQLQIANQEAGQAWTGKLFKLAIYGQLLTHADVEAHYDCGIANSAPVASSFTVTTLEDQDHEFDVASLGGFDFDGTALMLEIDTFSGPGALFSNTSGGYVELTYPASVASQLLYRPLADDNSLSFNGTHARSLPKVVFDFRLVDSKGAVSNTAQISVIVEPVDDPPTSSVAAAPSARAKGNVVLLVFDVATPDQGTDKDSTISFFPWIQSLPALGGKLFSGDMTNVNTRGEPYQVNPALTPSTLRAPNKSCKDNKCYLWYESFDFDGSQAPFSARTGEDLIGADTFELTFGYTTTMAGAARDVPATAGEGVTLAVSINVTTHLEAIGGLPTSTLVITEDALGDVTFVAKSHALTGASTFSVVVTALTGPGQLFSSEATKPVGGVVSLPAITNFPAPALASNTFKYLAAPDDFGLYYAEADFYIQDDKGFRSAPAKQVISVRPGDDDPVIHGAVFTNTSDSGIGFVNLDSSVNVTINWTDPDRDFTSEEITVWGETEYSIEITLKPDSSLSLAELSMKLSDAAIDAITLEKFYDVNKDGTGKTIKFRGPRDVCVHACRDIVISALEMDENGRNKFALQFSVDDETKKKLTEWAFVVEAPLVARPTVVRPTPKSGALFQEDWQVVLLWAGISLVPLFCLACIVWHCIKSRKNKGGGGSTKKESAYLHTL